MIIRNDGAFGTIRGGAAANIAALLLVACGSGEYFEDGHQVDEPLDEIGSVEQEVIKGTLMSSAANPGAVAVYYGGIRPCSGALIRRQWVLTARHCVTDSSDVLLSPLVLRVTRSASPGLTPPASGVVSVSQMIADSGKDYALLRISPPIEGPVALWNGTTAGLQGLSIRALGYGRNIEGNSNIEDGTSGAGTLRFADLWVSGTPGVDSFRLSMNGSGQSLFHGDSGGPSLRLTDTLGRSLPGVAGVHWGGSTNLPLEGSVDTVRAWIKRRQFHPGDVDVTHTSDIILTGGSGWTSIPVAFFSSVTHQFGATNSTISGFPSWAQRPGVKALSGDFDGDERTDVTLIGASNFTSVPIAFATGNGGFRVSNVPLTNFPEWASHAGVQGVSGDFNGDGRTDLALTGGAGWQSILVALSNGSGGFSVVSYFLADFPGWASAPGAKVLSGDFDGDGRDDVALTGVSGWTSVPIAFSNGNGSFFVTDKTLDDFPIWATTAGSKAVTGDFNGDGRSDIALMGGPGWSTVPIAYSTGTGSFNATNVGVVDFPGWAAQAGVKVTSGDLDGDFKDELMLTGVPGWGGIRVARNLGDGTFLAGEVSAGINFPTWATATGAQALSGSQGK